MIWAEHDFLTHTVCWDTMTHQASSCQHTVMLQQNHFGYLWMCSLCLSHLSHLRPLTPFLPKEKFCFHKLFSLHSPTHPQRLHPSRPLLQKMTQSIFTLWSSPLLARSTHFPSLSNHPYSPGFNSLFSLSLRVLHQNINNSVWRRHIFTTESWKNVRGFERAFHSGKLFHLLPYS